MLVYRRVGRQLIFGLLLTFLLLSTLSCGRVAPEHEPGQIQVTSTPAGAVILLDGEDTGQITPATISDLAPGSYVVTVQLANHVTSPPQTDVELSELEVVPAAFTLDATVGQLVVDSDPAGATIWVNGTDTGQITPATIDGVTVGTAVITLVHPEFHFYPSEFSAEVFKGQQTEVPAETFSTRSKRTVLLQGFSNVDCAGCPQMATNVHALMDEEAFSLDRVVYVKYSMSWPVGSHDPHYEHNPSENSAPYIDDYGPLYGYFGIPTLTIDGALAGSGGNPPDTADLRLLVDAATVSDPGFLMDVSADFQNLSIPVSVVLTPAVDLDLAGNSLHVALVQSYIQYDVAPGTEGETEFHWVFRDKANTTTALGTLTAGSPLEFNFSVSRNDDWDLATLQVLAFVRNNASLEILQAGSTMISASKIINHDSNLNDRPGGNRP